MIFLRQAEKSDISAIMILENSLFSPPWSEDSIKREIKRPGSYFPVAIRAGIIAGFAILSRAGDDCELFQIAVCKEHQRSGVAAKLLSSVILCAKENELNKIFLEVRESNAPAISLYKKFGFSQLTIRKDYYESPQENAVLMSL